MNTSSENYRKSIFITGAASGMGRSTAILFAQKGSYSFGSEANMRIKTCEKRQN